MTQPQTYYRDESESDVSGIVVVETGNEGVRVTENRSDVHWSAPFWMPEDEFNSSVVDATEKVGELPDDKYERVLSIARNS